MSTRTSNFFKIPEGDAATIETQQDNLNHIINGVFADFAAKIKDGEFGEDTRQRTSDEFISALNSSTAFKEVLVDVLDGAGVPRDNFGILATFMGYLVFSGYLIHGADTVSKVLRSVM